MYFQLLGPVEVWNEQQQYPVGGFSEQCVLAILLLEAGRTVSTQALAERLWDERVPAKAKETLQVYLSRLRSHLRAAGDDLGVITRSSAGGYRLEVAASQVDVRQAELLLEQARSAAVRPNPRQALSLLRQAEDLWVGDPLTGLRGEWAEGTRHALRERNRGTTLARIELQLRMGEVNEDLIGELAGLTTSERIDQRAIALLMRALNHAGRQDEALLTYRRAHQRLRSELGLDPSPELTEVHERILRGDPTLTAAPPAATGAGAPAPDTLEHDQPFLTGREAELGDVKAAITEDLRSGTSIAVYALDGMPGVGKSVVAIRAAHLLTDRCPDGRLQVNFGTHRPNQPPLTARQALVQLLEATGTPPVEIGHADAPHALVALWRQRTRGKRLLVLLDDVLDADQVESVMPAGAGSIVLVTSRRRLTGLHAARHHTVSLLPDEAAGTLLNRITGRDFSTQDPALTQFAHRCGGLPLAITVAAAYLRSRPGWSLADLLDRLPTTPSVQSVRPGRPTVESASSDARLTDAMRAAFTMSYDALSPQQQLMLRRIALHPGAHISLYAAAALTGIEPQKADLLLDVLVEHNLVIETRRHRYQLHDLIRTYALDQDHRPSVGEARDQAAEQQITAAIARMLDFYLVAARRVDHILYPERRQLDQPTSVQDQATVTADPDRNTPSDGSQQQAALWFPRLDSAAAARAWNTAESSILTTITDFAHTLRWYQHSSGLADALAQHLDRHGHWRQALTLLQQGLDDETASEAEFEFESGMAGSTVSDSLERSGGNDSPDSGPRSRRSARDTSRGVDRRAQLLTGLAAAHLRTGDLAQAQACAQQALAAFTSRHDARGRADALLELGRIHWRARAPAEALSAYQQAAALYEQHGLQRGNAVAEYHVGMLQFELGHHDDAFTRTRRALHVAQELHDSALECDALITLGEMYRLSDQFEPALAHFQTAQSIADDLEDPQNLAVLAGNIGATQLRLGQLEPALAAFRSALTIFQTLSDHGNEIDTLTHLADAHIRLGQHENALIRLMRASTLADQLNDPLRHARVHLATGNLHHAQGQVEQALRAYHSALQSASQAAAPLEQAHAHQMIGNLLAARNEHRAAAKHKGKARALYRRLGQPPP